MKRFVFSLQVLLKVKLALEKQQKTALMEVQKKLHEQEAQMRRLREQQEQMRLEFAKESQSGIRSDRLQIYGNYFDRIREDIAQQKRLIEETREELEKIQAELLRTMKEIKSLNKLRERQYQEYLAEVAREEEKAIGDLVSFKVATGGA